MKRAIHFIPSLKYLHCIRTYTGLRPYTPDHFNINVNGIAPGIIDTPLWEVYGPKIKEKCISGLIRGAGSPIDIAEVVVF